MFQTTNQFYNVYIYRVCILFTMYMSMSQLKFWEPQQIQDHSSYFPIKKHMLKIAKTSIFTRCSYDFPYLSDSYIFR